MNILLCATVESENACLIQSSAIWFHFCALLHMALIFDIKQKCIIFKCEDHNIPLSEIPGQET